MAHVPTVPNFSQWDFVYGDTDAAIIKDNARNAALVQFGGQLRQMTQTFNADLETVAEDKAAAAQSASEAQTFRNEAQEISETGLPPKAGNAGAILRVADDESGYVLDALLRHLLPVGEIKMFPATVAPPGFRKVNGDEISRTEYAALWEYAQASGNLASSEVDKDVAQFGPGDGETTFTLPDYRGEFMRWWDDGRGVDVDRGIGESQADQNRGHDHGGKTGVYSHRHTGSTSTYGHSHNGTTSEGGFHDHGLNGQTIQGNSFMSPSALTDGDSRPLATRTQGSGNHSHTFQTSTDYHSHTFSTSDDHHSHALASDGGDESRPRNIPLLACIRC